MGIWSLQNFFKERKLTLNVNIRSEVEKWRRKHPGEEALLVIDFKGLIKQEPIDNICGGRHKKLLKNLQTLLEQLKSTGAKLVFFSDLIIKTDRMEKYLHRRNQKVPLIKKLYEDIDSGIRLQDFDSKHPIDLLASAFYGLTLIAKEYGEINFAVDQDCDWKLARYARDKNAIAVISNDFDFIIYDGRWKLWSSEELNFDTLETVEYDRDALKLSYLQRPLFATLLQNDFTSKYHRKLVSFHNTLGPPNQHVLKVANYVRKFSFPLSTDNIHVICKNVFGNPDGQMLQAIKDSIDSYDLNYSREESFDPIANKIRHTNIYQAYTYLTSNIQVIYVPFYDFKKLRNGKNLSNLIAELIKRKIGLLKHHSNDDSYTFQLAAMQVNKGKYDISTEKPVYLTSEVPALDELLIDSDELESIKHDDEIIDIRWKLVGWILSISSNILETIRTLSKEYLLICVTLYVLVKHGLIDVEDADGILLTEHKIITKDKDVDKVQFISTLKTKYVRAAHVYNNAFTHIREAFQIVGLSAFISETFQFDGFYYQNYMNFFDSNETNVTSIDQKYRIYASHAIKRPEESVEPRVKSKKTKY